MPPCRRRGSASPQRWPVRAKQAEVASSSTLRSSQRHSGLYCRSPAASMTYGGLQLGFGRPCAGGPGAVAGDTARRGAGEGVAPAFFLGSARVGATAGVCTDGGRTGGAVRSCDLVGSGGSDVSAGFG